MKKRILTMLLVLSFLTGTTACGKKDADSVSTDTTIPATTETTTVTETVNERQKIKEELPEKDFGGYTFRILTRDAEHHLKEIRAEEETGETINDAVYKRNRVVEERFNIKIAAVTTPEVTETELTDLFKKSVMAGDDAFDLALPHTVHAGTAATQGLMYNWLDVPYVDFSKPWWNGGLANELTINKQLYLAVSDFCISAIDYTWAMVFNRELCEKYDIPDIYEMVNSGKWTIDEFSKIVKTISSDLNGDGKYDYDDLYGFTTHNNSAVLNWMFACDQKVTKMNADGSPELILNGDKMVSIVDKVYDLLLNGNNSFVITPEIQTKMGAESHDVAVSSKFAKNESLFAALRIYVIEQLRNMEADFGIVPFPKYDTTQTNYYTHVDGHAPLMCLPNTLSDPERTGIIIEALSAESYREVVPAVMDIVLQSKYARDEQSYQMLETILNGRVYTFGYIYDGWKGMQWSLVNLLNAKSHDFSSYYAKSEKAALRQYDTIMKAYQEIQQ